MRHSVASTRNCFLSANWAWQLDLMLILSASMPPPTFAVAVKPWGNGGRGGGLGNPFWAKHASICSLEMLKTFNEMRAKFHYEVAWGFARQPPKMP